jgi:hypothetical protein
MLTAKQQWCLKELGLAEQPEKDLRARHRECVEKYGAVRSFTRWLEQRVHRQWQRERQGSPYLGD